MKDYDSTIERNKRYIAKFLKEYATECQACGWKDTDVLDFYPSLKKFISHSYSRDRIDEEIIQRSILCANCQRLIEKGILEVQEMEPQIAP